MFLWTVLAWLSASANDVTCDLPVQKIDQGILNQREASKATDYWAFAYGFSQSEWDDMVNGSDVNDLYLRQLVEQGARDWDASLLAADGGHLSLRTDLSAKDLAAVKHSVRMVQENALLGEMFGNRKMLEATASYYLLGNDVPSELPSLRDQIRSLQELEKAFRMFNPHDDKKRYRKCLRSMPSKPEKLCKCVEYWSCADQPTGDKVVVRVTLDDPRKMPPTDLEISPLTGVRILDCGSPSMFQKQVMQQLFKIFPNVRVLALEITEFVPYPHLDGWASSVLALHIQAPMVGLAPQMMCQLSSLRYLTFGDVEGFSAFPECMGNLSQLIHVKVVGCNLTGGARTLPSTLTNLKELRIFEAFEQGRLNPTDDESLCPDASVPNRSDCVPGYVARADPPHTPVWRCPAVDGWHLWMDDMTLPWWHWESIEKMHIDANFIYGTIPEKLPELWPKLRSLDLHDLKLTGPLPLSLASLENLTQLQVQLNDLHCPDGVDVVARLMQHPRMRVLHVDANPRMCGCLPSMAPIFLHVQVGETSVEVGCADAKSEL